MSASHSFNSRNHHKGHKVLGAYCWTCRAQTLPLIPGWTRPTSGNFVHYAPWENNDGRGYTVAVVWANGEIERVKDGSACSVCGKHCKLPVSRSVTALHDGYRVILVSCLRD